MTDLPDRPAGNAAPPDEVRTMFDQIAARYEPLNAVISGFQEPRWRRRLVSATGLGPGMRAIDVASGTGVVARDLARVVGPNGHVLGVDVSAGMLARARNRLPAVGHLEYLVADAMELPVEDATYDAATIAFGMRNLPDYGRGFAEMRRAVRPGGIVACLEIARPSGVIGRVGRAWFEAVVPRIGQLAGQGDAYRYLVRSVRAYPPPEQIAAIMRDAGLVDVAWTPLTFGMVTLHTGRRP
ncbi:MAG: ubiquinone/menaquinone biosynthesis methyltransferase [Chloroflexota bacterium]|nr:MAG: ubiquinone/menaquinone biosynthesis methyltransferase [Chloroflexota bacterium]